MLVDLQNNLPAIISAVGGLGTAAFGLLEALKPVCPRINRIGFDQIESTVNTLTPSNSSEDGAAAGTVLPATRKYWRGKLQKGAPPINTLPHIRILQTLESNWVNGNDLAGQKAIAKSLIKLHLAPGNARKLAEATNVAPDELEAIAARMVSGAVTAQAQPETPAQPAAPPLLTQHQADTWSRFDLILTAMIDDCYQYADQVYRNWTRGLAAVLAVILALAGGWIVDIDATAATAAAAKAAASPAAHAALSSFWQSGDWVVALLVGILATPLAPVAKDLSSALATAVNTMQLVKKA